MTIINVNIVKDSIGSVVPLLASWELVLVIFASMGKAPLEIDSYRLEPSQKHIIRMFQKNENRIEALKLMLHDKTQYCNI